MSERLDIVPAKFFVHRHTYARWTFRFCQRQGIERLVQEQADPQIIGGGMAACGLMAHTLINRVVDHLPYYWKGLQTRATGRRRRVAQGTAIVQRAFQRLVGRGVPLLQAVTAKHAGHADRLAADATAGRVQRLDPRSAGTTARQTPFR